MSIPKKITIKKTNDTHRTEDILNLPKQQLVENNVIVQEAITKDATNDGTFFPRSIHLEDLDNGFLNWVKNFNVILEGSTVPVFFFTLQRFSEVLQTWSLTDSKDQLSLPVITVTKETPAKQGSMLGAISSVLPSNETYPLYKVPKIENGKTFFEYWEIPQPTYVDLQYKINFFSNHQRDINIFNEKILQEFKKPQNSINIFGHNFELKLEDISENHKKEIEERRYYRDIYVINLKGFILDEKDFVVKHSLNKINLDYNASKVKQSNNCEINIFDISGDCNTCLSITFNKKSQTYFEYKIPYDITLNYDNQSTLNNNVDYYVNGVLKNFPFSAVKGDLLKIDYLKTIFKPTIIKICGNK